MIPVVFRLARGRHPSLAPGAHAAAVGAVLAQVAGVQRAAETAVCCVYVAEMVVCCVYVAETAVCCTRGTVLHKTSSTRLFCSSRC